MSWALCFGHFAVPFFLLLFRSIRRDPFWLGFLAAWVLVFHYLDLYWLIMPVLYPEGAQPDWLDASVLATLVLASVPSWPMPAGPGRWSPIGDPRLSDSIAFPQFLRSDSHDSEVKPVPLHRTRMIPR